MACTRFRWRAAPWIAIAVGLQSLRAGHGRAGHRRAHVREGHRADLPGEVRVVPPPGLYCAHVAGDL